LPDNTNRDILSRFARGELRLSGMPAGTYGIHVLAAESGIAARTLRDWIKQKVLPKPIGRGRGARYDDGYLLRARVIQHLRSGGVSLRDIRSRLAALSEEQLQALVPPAPRPKTAEGVPVPPPEPTYPSMMWEAVQLMDGMLLLVNPGRGPVLRRIADDIYRHYAIPVAPAKG
jgi:DNA-binding transcriptional MerR regulator